RCNKAASPSGNCSTTSIRDSRLLAIVHLVGPNWSAPVKGLTMWPTFPESSARTHPSPGTSRGFVRKTSCREAHTTVRVQFRFRARELKLQCAVALCRGRRRQHTKRSFVHLKFYR